MLGRPVQALEQIAALLGQHVEAQMQQSGHRPIAIRIQDATLTPLRCVAPALPQAFLERDTVLNYMAARYGFTEDLASSERAPASSTELRINAALQAAMREAVGHTVAQAQRELHHTTWSNSTSGWQWQAQIQIGDASIQPLRIELDTHSSQTLERYAMQLRSVQLPSTGTATPQATIEVDVTAQLLKKTVSAATVQALRAGTVLPIAMGRSNVLINGTALLTATVAEHHGKLHLTAFETLE